MSRNRSFTKLTLEKAQAMRGDRVVGLSRKELAVRYGVSEATVKKVLAGHYWRSAEKIIPQLADALKKK